MIIDFHTHYFPDRVADKAMAILSAEAKHDNIVPYTKATLEDNLRFMRLSGVDIMVALNIAVTIRQEASINSCVIATHNESIIPFGSVHPDSPNWENELARLAEAGVKGVKFHPEYQMISVADKRWYPIYEYSAYLGLLMVVHCGYDTAYPESRRATPSDMAKVAKDFKDAKFICAHMGGMLMWEDVYDNLAGKEVFIDTSMVNGWLDPKLAKRIIDKHGADNVLFGSDLPWGSPKENIEYISGLGLSSEDMEKILGRNAERVLGL